jgi:hypothetical protein
MKSNRVPERFGSPPAPLPAGGAAAGEGASTAACRRRPSTACSSRTSCAVCFPMVWGLPQLAPTCLLEEEEAGRGRCKSAQTEARTVQIEAGAVQISADRAGVVQIGGRRADLRRARRRLRRGQRNQGGVDELGPHLCLAARGGRRRKRPAQLGDRRGARAQRRGREESGRTGERE